MLQGKICLVTGSSEGIGAAIARCFAQEGATVFAAARRDNLIEEWVQENSLQEKIIPVKMDVTDPNQIKQCIMRIKKEYGRLDVLVNNAAVEENDSIGAITRAAMQNMFETNVYGVIDLIQLASRLMRKNGGSIINITSRVGENGNAGQLVYSATKGAVIALTKSAAKELTPLGIRVNAVSPGLTETAMYHKTPKDKLESRLQRIMLGRPATPEEIADSVLFLASEKSGYVSGHILNVDGCVT